MIESLPAVLIGIDLFLFVLNTSNALLFSFSCFYFFFLIILLVAGDLFLRFIVLPLFQDECSLFAH